MILGWRKPWRRNRNQKSKIKNIFLIGYRGTGKTTVARILAQRLDWDWIDADGTLERRFGRTIHRIFADEGEAAFREKEAAVLQELCQLEQHVVATGGGIVLRDNNREWLRAAGRIVWLTADARTLWQRLQADPATSQSRPALTIGGLAEIEELLQVREPLYRCCADLIVDTAGRSPEEIANLILAQVVSAES